MDQDSPQPSIQVQLAILETLVSTGFKGVNERLDKLNGRVYTGEQERHALDKRLLVVETQTAPTSKTKIVSWAAGAAGVLTALAEAARAYFSGGGPTPNP